MVGRSNVGKSTLINAIVRQRIARTSAAPGKTRLANIYRVARGEGPAFYLVDLPGYGYARGGSDAARGFDELTRAYFARESQEGRDSQEGKAPAFPARPAYPACSALLIVDARHPGLESDLEAWRWLRKAVDGAAVVATKTDKLARGERIRALRQLESVFEHPVAPVSAVSGEGLDELWKVIDRLANNSNQSRSNSSSPAVSSRHLRKAATARRRPKN